MVKVALLIGVSEYQAGLNPLPGAVKDVEAMQRVLKHPEMGEFDEVKTLTNPEPIAMQEAIETLFSGRAKDDLALLFFSGHGVKDDNNRLYFATRLTRKNPKGDLVKATAVPAGFVQDVMSNSRCKRQVVLLDCCFSGAFAEGMTAKDDGTVDVQKQLGGEGRAVLTSSTSTQFSFEQQGSELSVYTRYIVEGIETGAADTDSDGSISIDELHEYAQKKVQEAAPAMKPKIYAVEEGFRIRLAKASIGDPKLRYRKEVEQFASRGEISSIGRSVLDKLQNRLGLTSGEATVIEADVLKPYREYQDSLQKYKQAYTQAIQRERTLSDYTKNELKLYQKVLGLRDEDIALITRSKAENLPFKGKTEQLPNKAERDAVPKHTIRLPKKLMFLIGAGSLGIALALIKVLPELNSDAPSPLPSTQVTSTLNPVLNPEPTVTPDTTNLTQSQQTQTQQTQTQQPQRTQTQQTQTQQPQRTQTQQTQTQQPQQTQTQQTQQTQTQQPQQTQTQQPQQTQAQQPQQTQTQQTQTQQPQQTQTQQTATSCPSSYSPADFRGVIAHAAFFNEWNVPVTVVLYHPSTGGVFSRDTVPPGANNFLGGQENFGDDWGVCFEGKPNATGFVNNLGEISDYNPDWEGSPLFMIQNPRSR